METWTTTKMGTTLGSVVIEYTKEVDLFRFRWNDDYDPDGGVEIMGEYFEDLLEFLKAVRSGKD